MRACAHVQHTSVKSTEGQCGATRGSFQLLEEPPTGRMAEGSRPPCSPAPTPQASGPREGDKVRLVGKIFFFLSFFVSLLFKNPVVFLSRQRPAPSSAGPWVAAQACVASNLWYCMFWAGKRGRRSSAGSLESNVEVSRGPSGWLSCVASRPRFCLLSFFSFFSLLLPSSTEARSTPPAWHVHASRPAAPRPSPLVGAGTVGAGAGLYVTV